MVYAAAPGKNVLAQDDELFLQTMVRVKGNPGPTITDKVPLT